MSKKNKTKKKKKNLSRFCDFYSLQRKHIRLINISISMTHHVSMTAINEQQYDTIQFHCRFYVLRLFHLEEKFARISIDRSIDRRVRVAKYEEGLHKAGIDVEEHASNRCTL